MRLKKIAQENSEILIKIQEVENEILKLKQSIFSSAISCGVESSKKDMKSILKIVNKIKKEENTLKSQEDMLEKLELEKNQLTFGF